MQGSVIQRNRTKNTELLSFSFSVYYNIERSRLLQLSVAGTLGGMVGGAAGAVFGAVISTTVDAADPSVTFPVCTTVCTAIGAVLFCLIYYFCSTCK